RKFMDALSNLILEIQKEKIPLIYKVLDKSDKMEEDEFEKYVYESFENEYVVQGILKLKNVNSIEELMKKFDNVPDQFYESDGYKELVNFEKLLSDANLEEYCSFSSSVVRGLDYYTGIVYEVYDTGKENIRSIFGGGRYDDLLSIFTDELIPATGFGLGVLMLTLFLKTYNLIPEEIRERDYTDTIYIASISEDVSIYALKLANLVRREDFPCLVDYRFSNLKNQLSKANDLGVLITLIIGPNEMEQNEVTIKNMKTQEQKTIKIEDLIEKIYNIIDEYED
ncbi:MAG: His/Gly/Thr/Pro-type tRNA ligase C-terminal domain-containing protein, partial [Promethearchaeota archaeon]